MQLKPLHVSAAIVATWFLLTDFRNPTNPPIGRTGAPGETTCAASGCHSGGNFTGTVSIAGIPDTVAPNQSYTVTLTNAGNATRAGFQLTCLDNANAKCGTLTAGSGNNVASNSANGRQYVRQSAPKTLTGGNTSWSFTWKAPATASGDLCKFYFVSLCADGNGQRTNDNPVVATKNAVLKAVSPAEEAPEAAKSWLDFQANTSTNLLTVNLLRDHKGRLEIFDMQGKMVLAATLSANNQVDIGELPSGLFVAHVAAAGKVAAMRLAKP